MNEITTEQIIETLRHCHNSRCTGCPGVEKDEICNDLQGLAADRLEQLSTENAATADKLLQIRERIDKLEAALT